MNCIHRTYRHWMHWLSLYWGDEFLILRLFVSLKFPFTTKIVKEFQRIVRIYVRYNSRKHENFRYWPNKSHDVTIETPTNHSSSRWDIVFCFVEKNLWIVRRFVITKKGSSFQITLKLRRNHDLNAFARMDISFTRLCLWPSNPNTVWKLRLSAFCMCYNFLMSYWWVRWLKYIKSAGTVLNVSIPAKSKTHR